MAELTWLPVTTNTPPTDLDHFTLLCTLLDVQSYYFIPLAGYSVETQKRNILKAFSTAQGIVQTARQLHRDHGFLSFAPHFVARTMIAVICVIVSVQTCTFMQDVPLETRDTSVREGKYTSALMGQLPV